VTLLNVFVAHSRVSLQAVSAISVLFVDALDNLLSSESFIADTQDVVLRLPVPLGHL
jgi:hypothetical protein